MAANRIQLQNALHKPYDRVLFSREVLSPVFGSGFTLNSALVPAGVLPNKSESAAIDKVWIYGNIQLDDSTEITCYEVLLQPKVRIEQSKVAIQQYVRKLLTAGQAALINFVAPAIKNVWRLTLVAKDSVLTEKGVKEKTTNAKRYTFLLGPSETCKTAAERFEVLSTEREITFQTLVNAFSVEKLSKAFFDEYTQHYQNFCKYLQDSNYRKSVFNISFPVNATELEKDKASKPIRDFVKKLLGRIVFLYFVQKKGWLGASDTNYTDGLGGFIKQLFNKSGGNDTFYSNWLTVLFFDTLNKERANDDFKMPDSKIVKVPFLNGGLFDKEEFDEHILTFKSKLFHHPDFEDTILTERSKGNARGFLDFLDAFNFTVYEDSPDDHTVAVDPEMLGHIFENLLEDNKDKGAFYTPKEIVHYMCQESLTEYCLNLDFSDSGITMIDEDKRNLLESIIKKKEVDFELFKKSCKSEESCKSWFRQLEMHLDHVKICDPAIGSGAFPMGLLQEIFSIEELIAYETGKEWKPAETKLNIIQNSIYGVDIEKGAVDIARLRFWLSLVVDEDKPKALPNLDYKIVVGDSLISKFDGEIVEIDWERKSIVGKADEYVKNVQRLLIEVADKQKIYFNPNNKNKKNLQAEIRNLKIELLINQLSFNKELYVSKTMQKGGFMPTAADIKHNTERELQIKGFDNLISKLKNLLKNPDEPFNHFDWKLDFPEVLNPYLFERESFKVESINLQILALNTQIDAINKHLKDNKIDEHLAHIQANIAQNQVAIILYQLSDIQKELEHLYGQIIKSDSKIVSESDMSFIYKIKSINTGINNINIKIDSINPLLKTSHPQIGFDIVIGNPPYGAMLIEKEILKKIFPNTSSGNIDSYKYFIDKSLDLVKIHGILNFITSDSFLEKEYFIDLRMLIIKNSEKVLCIKLGDNVFESVNLPTAIILLKVGKKATTMLNTIDVSKTALIEDKIKNLESENFNLIDFNTDSFVRFIKKEKFINDFECEPLINLYDQVMGVKVYQIGKGKPKQTRYEIENDVFISTQAHTSEWIKFIDSGVKKYYCEDSNRFIKYGQWLAEPREIRYFENPKIILREVVNPKPFVCYYLGMAVVKNTNAVIIQKKKDFDLFYLLSILNSELFAYFIKVESPKSSNKSFPSITSNLLKSFPIKKIPLQEQTSFIQIATYILYLKSENPTIVVNQLVSTYFEQIIDGMVYELYFPELLKKHNREIIKHLGDLPEFTEGMSDEQKSKICKKVFERLHDAGHPVRINLEKMKEEIPAIKIMEGGSDGK